MRLMELALEITLSNGQRRAAFSKLSGSCPLSLPAEFKSSRILIASQQLCCFFTSDLLSQLYQELLRVPGFILIVLCFLQ